MKLTTKKLTTAFAALILMSFTAGAMAADPNPKLGRVYFKMVCTACHMANVGRTIPPSSKTMSEWIAYMAADKHDASGETNPSVKYYVSQEYRASIADTNKAAKKFLKMPNDQLFKDVREFTITGAKDSDTPASCE